MTMIKIKKLWNRITNMIFVKKCASCKELLPYDYEEKLCLKCLGEWYLQKNELCPICHKEQIFCRCAFGKESVDSLRHLVLYQHDDKGKVSNKVVYALKKSNDENVFDFVAGEMVDNIIDTKRLDNTVVTGVPRNPNSIKEYGYDHAKKLAKKVAEILDLKYVDVLYHSGGLREQKSLNKQQRELNAKRKCYIVPEKTVLIKGKRILLVDDMATTGAMTGACAQLLKENGAIEVNCILAAKNPNKLK